MTLSPNSRNPARPRALFSAEIFLFFLLLCFIFIAPFRSEAAISFVGSCEHPVDTTPNGADATLTLPTMLENDLLIIAYTIGDNDGVDFDMDASASLSGAGFTEVSDLFADDTQDISLGVYWKIMGATPDTTATVDGQGGVDAAVAAVCMAFRGVDTATPMDVTPVGGSTLNTMHADPGAIDHNNPAGVWTVAIGASGHTLGAAGTYTFPTGYTTDAIDSGSDDTSDATIGLGYRSSGVSDPEDPGVMTHSGSDSTAFASATTTIALRPSTVVAPTVQTTFAGNVGATGATINGAITAGSDATQHGFAFSTSATLSTSVSTSSQGAFSGVGNFSSTTSNLSQNQTYYFRAYATNSAGTSYGSILNFTTGNTTPSRAMRLFEGFTLKFFNGTMKLFQR